LLAGWQDILVISQRVPFQKQVNMASVNWLPSFAFSLLLSGNWYFSHSRFHYFHVLMFAVVLWRELQTHFHFFAESHHQLFRTARPYQSLGERGITTPTAATG
jgi:hypothetical protein